jgi:hypothetical protein
MITGNRVRLCVCAVSVTRSLSWIIFTCGPGNVSYLAVTSDGVLRLSSASSFESLSWVLARSRYICSPCRFRFGLACTPF